MSIYGSVYLSQYNWVIISRSYQIQNSMYLYVYLYVCMYVCWCESMVVYILGLNVCMHCVIYLCTYICMLKSACLFEFECVLVNINA